MLVVRAGLALEKFGTAAINSQEAVSQKGTVMLTNQKILKIHSLSVVCRC